MGKKIESPRPPRTPRNSEMLIHRRGAEDAKKNKIKTQN
jgi:hypothetical protein